MTTQVLVPNGVIPFGQTGLPAFLQNQQYQSSLDEQQLGTSVDKITQKDGSIVVNRDGVTSQPTLSIDVVVLDAAPHSRETYRAYYDGTWTEGESTPPDCYSADGKTPSPHAQKPQCSNCAMCPKNIKGSGQNGEGAACSYFKHVAVAIYPELDKVYRLKVASRSLFSKDYNGVPSPLGGMAWGFSNYAKNIKGMGVPWESIVTRVSLPKGQTHGFFFTPVGYLSEDQFKQVLELRDSPEMADVLTVEASASMEHSVAQQAPQLPPVATQPVALTGRDKWLADTTLPQDVKNWIAMVDDETAHKYLATNYPQSV